MNSKRMIAFVLAAVMLMGMAGCSGSEKAEESAEEESDEAPTSEE